MALEEIYSIKSLYQKKERLQSNDLSFLFRGLEERKSKLNPKQEGKITITTRTNINEDEDDGEK
jgi:hypothetical protein